MTRATNTSVVDSRYYEAVDGGYRCLLCPNFCIIRKGSRGLCGTRRACPEGLRAVNYGQVSALNIDPMEKKPLYHYHPGEDVLSVGGLGCNLSCDHCQNHNISQTMVGEGDSTFISPEKLRELCRAKGVRNLAFTYNESGIWLEYILDVLEGQDDLHGIMVSNGYLNPEPVRDLCRVVRAMNIDVKGFSEEFYRNVCHGSLAPVLETAAIAHSEGLHLELTYLVIPGRNDSPEDIRKFCDWVGSSLSVSVPVHFTRFHPDYLMMDAPSTPLETLAAARDSAYDSGLKYVYIGNAPVHLDSHTYCPSCGEKVVERRGFEARFLNMEDGRCQVCGKQLDFIL